MSKKPSVVKAIIFGAIGVPLLLYFLADRIARLLFGLLEIFTR